MDEFLPIEQLRTLLLERGHCVEAADGQPETLLIRPPESIYLTVALECDGVMYRRWRERYFLCNPDSSAILTSASVPEAFRRLS